MRGEHGDEYMLKNQHLFLEANPEIAEKTLDEPPELRKNQKYNCIDFNEDGITNGREGPRVGTMEFVGEEYKHYDWPPIRKDVRFLPQNFARRE